jgi:hypothetical protein
MHAVSFYGATTAPAESSSWQKTKNALEKLKTAGPRSFTNIKVFAKQDDAFQHQSASNIPLRIFSFEVLT